MKFFPEDRWRFIASGVAAAFLLVGASVAVSNDDLLAQAGISPRSQTASFHCGIPGVGCGGGSLPANGIGEYIWEPPYYGGLGTLHADFNGYKTRTGVTAQCTLSLGTGYGGGGGDDGGGGDYAETKTMNGGGEATFRKVGPVNGPTQFRVTCYNFWMTGVTSASRVITLGSLPAPVITLSANPATHTYRPPAPVESTITWGSTNVGGCRLSGPGLPVVTRTQSECVTAAPTTVPFTSYGTFTYNLETLLGATNWVSARSVSVQVVPPPPVMSITANGASPSVSVPHGSTATIAWEATDVMAGSCVVSNNRNSISWLGESGSQQTATLTQPITYRLNCKRLDNTNAPQRTVVISMQPVFAPTCALSSTPVSIVTGGSAILSYSIAGSVTSANISATPPPSVGAVTPPSGTRTVSPAQSTSYTMTVTGPGGSNTCSTNVTVGSISGPASVSLSANPMRVQPGGQTALTWSASGVTACTLYENDVVISTEGAGAGVPRTINGATVYRLSCTNGLVTETKSITVNVLGTYIEL